MFELELINAFISYVTSDNWKLFAAIWILIWSIIFTFFAALVMISFYESEGTIFRFLILYCQYFILISIAFWGIYLFLSVAINWLFRVWL